MSWSQTDLDNIESAIAMGARTFSHNGRTISYSSLDEMLRVRDIIREALGTKLVGRTYVLGEYNKGLT